ncbi:MAG TPA: hypothetical protein VHR66_29955 [Gemmataceae bacterium]|nr:hypothetical protein [Gemmataceae bacterium]
MTQQTEPEASEAYPLRFVAPALVVGLVVMIFLWVIFGWRDSPPHAVKNKEAATSKK